MAHTPQLLPTTLNVLRILQTNHITAYLYGSQGVSLYLGNFRIFGDMDVLVPHNWLQEDWHKLCTILLEHGYRLTDEHEHEFTNKQGQVIAFADLEILQRDKIVTNLESALSKINVDGQNVYSFTPEVFLHAYQFSLNDGYRQKIRNKNDAQIILLLEDYLRNKNE